MNGYLVQGLRSNTLVAGKTTALRLQTAPWPASGAAAVQATIIRPDGSSTNVTWPLAKLVIVDAGKNTESIVVLIPGSTLTYVGAYYIQAKILTVTGSVAASYLIDGVQLLPTKDLRMMVNRIWSNTGPNAKPGEVEAAAEAMKRLAAIYPVRDGIGQLNGNYNAGLRYNYDNNPQGPPQQDDNLGSTWAPFHNPPEGKDSLDCAIAYRFPDAGEDSGAIARPKYENWLSWTVIVWEGPIPQPFSHETGHNLGLEPPTSPHFDPSGQASHSKHELIDAADVTLGFDIQFNQPFPEKTYDVMFPTGPAPGFQPNQISLNSFDWEYIRTQLLKHSSTGPPEPAILWQALGGKNLSGYPCAARNLDGRLEVFVIGSDGVLYHIWEQIPGGAWSGWSTLEGNKLAGPVISATNLDGRLQVFVCGSDRQIYSRAQAVPNGGWNPWFGIGGNQVKGFSVARNADGRLQLATVFGNGQLNVTGQLKPNGNWSGWTSLGGNLLKGPVTLAANADGRLEAFVVGGDGNIYHNWQTLPNGSKGWNGWANLIAPGLGAVADLRADRAGDGRLFVLLMMADQSVRYLTQTVPNGGWAPAVNLFGRNLRWPLGLGRTDDGRLEVAVIGGDKKLYSLWQVDASRTSVWTNWTMLGGSELRDGVALMGNRFGQIEMFIIGGDGVLYRGFRSGS